MRSAVLMYILFSISSGFGQSLDSMMLSENTLSRPLTTHARQWRTNAGYELALNLLSFDSEGDRIKLQKRGISSISHRLWLQLQYGISERLQVAVAISYFSQKEILQTRYRSESRFPLKDIRLKENTTNESKGGEDIYLGVDYRLPISWKHDWVFTSGIFVPVSAHEPREPEIRFTDVPDIFQFTDDQSLDILNRNRNGRGVFLFRLGMMFKYRLRKTGITLMGGYENGWQTGTTRRWQYRLEMDSSLVFKPQEVRYALPVRITGGLTIERQLFPWFSASLFYTGSKQNEGWNSSSALSVTNPDRELHSFGFGYELIVTHKLWLRQAITVPVTGTNIRGPLLVSIAFVYNYW